MSPQGSGLREALRVVLVGPTEPGNVGAAARAMMNMGLRRLVLVPEERCPAEDLLGREAERRAGRARDLLDASVVASDLPAALEGTTFAAAATARVRARVPVHGIEDLAGLVLPKAAAGEEVALVFGREDKGLSNEELDRCQAVVTVPTHPDHPSLNLSHAVLLLAYEVTRAARRDLLSERSPGDGDSAVATADEREAMYRQMREVLLRIGYLDPVAPEHIEGDLRRLVDRARPTRREVTLLRGIWSQMDWAAFREEP